MRYEEVRTETSESRSSNSKRTKLVRSETSDDRRGRVIKEKWKLGENETLAVVWRNVRTEHIRMN